jgi:cytoskeletal protein CcmA (bactofilin family)
LKGAINKRKGDIMFKQKNAIGGLEKTVESFETIIGASTEVHGRILIEESVRIDGSVIGNIEARQGKSITVALGKTGSVRGDIHAHRVLIAGTVEGNVYASEKVELHNGSSVRGDIAYGQLAMEYGAVLNGALNANAGADERPLLTGDSETVFQDSWDKIKGR